LTTYQIFDKLEPFKRLEDRLGLKALDNRPFIVPPAINLVHEISPFLLKRRYIETTINRAAADGPGVVQLLSVPDGRKYYIHCLNLGRTTGDGTLTNIRLLPSGASANIPIYTQGASAHLNTQWLPRPWVLNEGDILYVEINAITTDSSWNLRILYEEEDAF